MQNSDLQPYVEPVLEKRERLVEIVEASGNVSLPTPD
jgi:hypothetical protein